METFIFIILIGVFLSLMGWLGLKKPKIKCPVCGYSCHGDSVCSNCAWESKTKAVYNCWTKHEQAAYQKRLQEAKMRWEKFGRYEQSPKKRPANLKVAYSGENIAIGGQLLDDKKMIAIGGKRQKAPKKRKNK